MSLYSQIRIREGRRTFSEIKVKVLLEQCDYIAFNLKVDCEIALVNFMLSVYMSQFTVMAKKRELTLEKRMHIVLLSTQVFSQKAITKK